MGFTGVRKTPISVESFHPMYNWRIWAHLVQKKTCYFWQIPSFLVVFWKLISFSRRFSRSKLGGSHECTHGLPLPENKGLPDASTNCRCCPLNFLMFFLHQEKTWSDTSWPFNGMDAPVQSVEQGQGTGAPGYLLYIGTITTTPVILSHHKDSRIPITRSGFHGMSYGFWTLLSRLLIP